MSGYFCIEKYRFVDQLKLTNSELFCGVGEVCNNVLSVMKFDIYLVKSQFYDVLMSEELPRAGALTPCSRSRIGTLTSL